MARGFESKSVADQQELADSPFRGRREQDPDPAVVNKRRGLELALADVRTKLGTAQADGHRQMLLRAEAALEKDLKALSPRASS
jgi:hypothetical protein